MISDDFLDLKSQQSAIINARRSIVANRDIKINEKIKLSDISIKRPGTGIPPLYLDKIIGLTVEKKIKKMSQLNGKTLKDKKFLLLVMEVLGENITRLLKI